MKFSFHFIWIDIIVLDDLFEVIIIKRRVDHGQFMHIGELPKVIASKNGTITKIARQSIDTNTNLCIWFFYFKKILFINHSVPIATQARDMIDAALIYFFIFIQQAIIDMQAQYFTDNQIAGTTFIT